VGDVCGQDIPNSPCTAGTVICKDGKTQCSGQLQGTPEICNGKDDDCDGVVDNGVQGGQPCFDDTYDKIAYPGPRRSGQCKPGLTTCDPTATSGPCVGAQGPTPEVCDGLDNDCDGQIDESGTPPDGITGTADPGDKTHVIGQPCQANSSQCKAGVWTCDHGKVICAGGTTVRPEVCDCQDNNCNGVTDEDTPTAPICAAGKTCVKTANGTCECAAPCKAKEFPCTGGLVCESDVVASNGGAPLGKGYCVQPDACGDCSKKTVSLSDGTILCAPTGIDPKTGHSYPLCQCKGSACHEPCFGVSNCDTGQGCAPRQGTCEPLSNCNFFGCPQGQACSPNRVCVDNPCVKDPCPTDQACVPTADFSSRNCVASCAGVSCASNEICVSGTCQPTGCPTACTGSDVCRPATGDSGVGACGPSLCTATSCLLGEYCDPATGRCGVDPCEGVVCPSGQACELGECVNPPKPVTPPDAGHVTTDGATGGGGATGAGGKGSGTTTTPNQKSAFGLATGGGGCACSVPSSKNESPVRGLLAAAFAAMALRARRKRPRVAARGGAR
jgi:MYXO-CTERM domain-containing protein